MSHFATPTSRSIPIVATTPDAWSKTAKTLSKPMREWAKANGFEGKAKQSCLLPNPDGSLHAVLWGMDEDPWAIGALATKLPKGTYRLDDHWEAHQLNIASLSWGLATYRFDHYRQKTEPENTAKLALPKALKAENEAWVESICWVRDMINMPVEDLNPKTLADEAAIMAKRYKAKCHITEGDALLKKGFRAIHAVGRAGRQAPRLIDIAWGNKKHKKITLVGKGVCFDTGGVDIKTAAGMREMKKDMGGAAHVLGLARHIMHHKLPVSLRVLIPAVENNIDQHAYRPGDIITTYSGKTVEVGNTDAEGRLILADALALAEEKNPDLLIDFATLTGAARIAMGPTLPALFSQDAAIAKKLMQHGEEVCDPLWHMPLYAPYNALIKSDLADICNAANTPYGGAITAALFLQHFVSPKTTWLHFDIMAANLTPSPGKPKGGEAMGIRAVYALIEEMIKA